MLFKNEAQLRSFLMIGIRDAVEQAQEKIYQILDMFVKEYYSDYSPELYERTYQLYRSLVKTDVYSNGNGYEAQVYFDLSSLNYVTGANPSGEQVMEAAAYGGHGAEGLRVVFGNTGADIWNGVIPVLSTEAYEILREELIAQGILVR